MDYKTQVTIRAVNTEWLNIVEINDYVFYGTTESELSQIVHKLKHIQKSYSLELRKNVVNDMKILGSEIGQLNHLTKLKIAAIYRDFKTEQSWDQLTKLSNIKQISPLTMPTDLQLQFPNLEILHASLIKRKNTHHLFTQIWTLTNLRSLRLATENSTFQIDGFSNLNKLTSLQLQFLGMRASTFNQDIAPNLCKYLTNLKEFYLTFDDGDNSVFRSDIDVPELTLLTALEKLTLENVPLGLLNSTNLTYLFANMLSNDAIENAVSSLVNLKELEAGFTDEDGHYTCHFFSVLTALDALGILFNNESGTNINPWQYLNSACTLLSPVEISQLTSLEKLYSQNPGTYNEIQNFTRLTSLELFANCEKANLDVSKLPNLEGLTVWGPNTLSVTLTPSLKSLSLGYDAQMILLEKVDLSKFPNLENLYFSAQISDRYYGWEAATKLTRLRISAPANTRCGEVNFLINLTNLRELTCQQEQTILPYLVNSTKLNSISISSVKPAHLETLTKFGNLTHLRIRSPLEINQMTESVITRLTTLRSLEGASFQDSKVVEELRRFLPKLWWYWNVSVTMPDEQQ